MKTQKQKIHIDSVWIEKAIDLDGDNSYLGEYSNRTGAGWYVDRVDGVLKNADGDILATDILATRIPTFCDESRQKRYVVGFQHDGSAKNWEHVDDNGVSKAFLRCRYKANNNERRINDSRCNGNLFAYFGVVGWQNATSRNAKIRCLDVVYCCLDFLRLEDLNNGEWNYVGIVAKARIRMPSGIQQTFRSLGLWGIESDSGDAFFDDVQKEELESLRSELQAIGLKDRAIDRAFQKVDLIEKG
jgi:hypothetical protein